jgi:hypothetical protein
LISSAFLNEDIASQLKNEAMSEIGSFLTLQSIDVWNRAVGRSLNTNSSELHLYYFLTFFNKLVDSASSTDTETTVTLFHQEAVTVLRKLSGKHIARLALSLICEEKVALICIDMLLSAILDVLLKLSENQLLSSKTSLMTSIEYHKLTEYITNLKGYLQTIVKLPDALHFNPKQGYKNISFLNKVIASLLCYPDLNDIEISEVYKGLIETMIIINENDLNEDSMNISMDVLTIKDIAFNSLKLILNETGIKLLTNDDDNKLLTLNSDNIIQVTEYILMKMERDLYPGIVSLLM